MLAVPAPPGPEIISRGRGDEVVALAWQELHRVRLRGEGAEADREHT